MVIDKFLFDYYHLSTIQQRTNYVLLYLDLLPFDLMSFFHQKYLAKELNNVVWKHLVPFNRLSSPSLSHNKGDDLRNAARYCAQNGYLKILMRLQSEVKLDAWTFACAAEGGNLEVVKWLYEKDVEWNCDSCSSAGGEGHLEVLK